MSSAPTQEIRTQQTVIPVINEHGFVDHRPDAFAGSHDTVPFVEDLPFSNRAVTLLSDSWPSFAQQDTVTHGVTALVAQNIRSILDTTTMFHSSAALPTQQHLGVIEQLYQRFPRIDAVPSTVTHPITQQEITLTTPDHRKLREALALLESKDTILLFLSLLPHSENKTLSFEKVHESLQSNLEHLSELVRYRKEVVVRISNLIQALVTEKIAVSKPLRNFSAQEFYGLIKEKNRVSLLLQKTLALGDHPVEVQLPYIADVSLSPSGYTPYKETLAQVEILLTEYTTRSAALAEKIHTDLAPFETARTLQETSLDDTPPHLSGVTVNSSDFLLDSPQARSNRAVFHL